MEDASLEVFKQVVNFGVVEVCGLWEHGGGSHGWKNIF